MAEESGLEAVINAARESIQLFSADSQDFAVVPEGCSLEDLEPFKSHPRRLKQTVTIHDQNSFCDYVNTFAEQDISRIFADHAADKITAVLDYHGDDPSFAEHRAVYTLPKSPQWKVWKERNKKPMTHIAFAMFVEENALQIYEPKGARMLEIARTFKATKTVNFVSSQTLQNGDEQFTYVQQTDAGAGPKGNATIPEKLQIGMPIYLGGKLVKMEAWLRYRLEDGKLTFSYEIVQLEEMELAAFCEVVAAIEKETKIKPWLASI